MARASQVDGVLQKVTTVADRVLRAGRSLSFLPFWGFTWLTYARKSVPRYKGSIKFTVGRV